MKKLSVLIVCSFIITLSFAQVERKNNHSVKTDSVKHKMHGKGDSTSVSKKQMMKDLNLSKEQKIKLKEARQANKAKKQAIENDEKLSKEEKETKLKALHQEQAKGTMAVLNEEQKEKLKKMKHGKKGKKGEKTGEAENR
jgi:Spy/CpxP family protein refolding chaperone